jgi:protein phosphatase
MLARLRGMVQALTSPDQAEATEPDLEPTWDESGSAAREEASPAIPVAVRVVEVSDVPAETTPQPEGEAPIASPTSAPERVCSQCQAPAPDGQTYCANCGWIFPEEDSNKQGSVAGAPGRLKGRYELGERIGERGSVVRFRGLDYDGSADGVPVVILQAPAAELIEAVAGDAPEASSAPPAGEELASIEGPPPASVEAVVVEAPWPGLAWERTLLEHIENPALPRVLDQFAEGGSEYLVEELPTGQALWDAWDDPEVSAHDRFGWLRQLAEALERLHECGAMLEALRPEIVVVTPSGRARLTDVSDLLPLPLPPNPPIRATYYTAPELVLSSDRADARADLYSFGAMLYALHLGRELTDLDFELQGVPKSLIERFPTVHPLFARLVGKTFCREPDARFPTEEAAPLDPTGFTELLSVLEQCSRALDQARLEVAAWTTTGMVRTGNEDAFAFLQSAEAYQDELREAVLILLADGMGGYEAGEVAAALAVRTLREYLLRQEPFAALTGTKHDSDAEADVDACKRALEEGLREANRQVYAAAHSGPSRRTMGCTAEAVFADGRNMVVGHVGDSRAYHLHRGELVQLTRDQTWVNRMVDLGTLSAAEAEGHPRRHELHQAIGGHADVEPAVYHARLQPGDWVLVCSDGLSNHVTPEVLREMLLSASSAEGAARRLVNYVNLQGATDNATVVVVRAT